MTENQLSASHLYSYYRPSECGRRIYLQHKHIPEAKPSPYEQVIRKLGERHEKAYLNTLKGVEDLSAASFTERIYKIKQLVRNGVSIIYQPGFVVDATWSPIQRTITGQPDFIVREGNSYIIRDCKIARRIQDKDHPEILRQLELYGWLFQQTTGLPPAGLEVVSGTGETLHIPYDGGVTALGLLHTIDKIQKLDKEPYEPAGWSKCQHCRYFERCWKAAEDSRDLALVPEVDKGLILALHSLDIKTIEELAGLDEGFLFNLKRPWGSGKQKVGKKASRIITQAKALADEKKMIIGKLCLPPSPNFVIFDVEGLPPQLDEIDKVYLWGLQVYGNNPSPYMCALADFGTDGDRNGWFKFLENCSKIFASYGDLPFIHWSSYEKTKLKTYIERYGDPDGIGARVKRNLKDLFGLTKKALVLPCYSYSLKQVEKLAGYRRLLPEAAGDWAMAKYIEATELEDPNERQKVMNEIIRYNQEDLEATWTVLQWLWSMLR